MTSTRAALAAFLLLIPVVAPGQNTATKFIVWYDPGAMAVVETDIPSTDAEAENVYSASNHPVTGCTPACVRLEITNAEVAAEGFPAALSAAVTGAGYPAPTPLALQLLGPQVETTLAQNGAREALQ